MARRVSMPAADDLFRRTGDATVRAVPDPPADLPAEPTASTGVAAAEPSRKGASGRIRHDEKVTVYVTSEELLALERTRLTLRGEHGLGVDRGRLIREALHLALEEFEALGEASALVRRLREA